MFTVYTLIKVFETLHLAALWGSTLKRKNLLLLEQIHSFKSRPQLVRASLPRKANRKSQKSFSFIEMVEKDGGVPKHDQWILSALLFFSNCCKFFYQRLSLFLNLYFVTIC